MRATAIVPVKRFGAAKQRLQPEIEPLERDDLVRTMLRRVFEALRSATRVDRPIVVTGETNAAELARRFKFEVVNDEADASHSEAAMFGIHAATAHGAESVVLLPGDCPELSSRELDGLLDRLTAPCVTIIPDRHGTGTNGLVLAPPHAIEPAFGPGSCARHAKLAEAAGVPHAIEQIPSLALDIDTPEDLALWRRSS